MTMTVKEIAKSLNISERTVQRHAANLFPESIKNGEKTSLNELQATRIKEAVERSGRNDLDNVVEVRHATTDLEMFEKVQSAMAWLSGKVQTLQEENNRLRPIAAAHQTLTDSEGACTIAELAKNIGMGELKLFKALREKKILISGGPSHNLPYESEMQKGWFRVHAVSVKINGEPEIKRQTLVTPKGQSEIAKLFPRQLEASK